MTIPPATLTREEWLTLGDRWSAAGAQKCYICGDLGEVFTRPKLIDHYQLPHCRKCRDSVRKAHRRRP